MLIGNSLYGNVGESLSEPSQRSPPGAFDLSPATTCALPKLKKETGRSMMRTGSVPSILTRFGVIESMWLHEYECEAIAKDYELAVAA